MGKHSQTGHSDLHQHEGSASKKSKMSYQKQWRQGGRGGSRGGHGGYRAQGPSSGGGGGRDKLSVGLRGFLCSCNFNERDCTKEAYNLLNEYFRDDEDKILTETVPESTEKEGSQTSDTVVNPGVEGVEGANDDDDDIEKALQAEVKQLKSHENRYKFKSVDCEVPNLVFISTTVEDPAKLARRIFEDVYTKKEQKSKFLLRMLPIDTVCKAYLDDLEAAFRGLVPKHFPAGEFVSFQIVFKSRYNGNIHREDVIKLLADIVVELNSLSVVDLTNPTCTIIVEVIKNKICIGFLKDFALYKKYNLIEAATPTPAGPIEVVGAGGNPTPSDAVSANPEAEN